MPHSINFSRINSISTGNRKKKLTLSCNTANSMAAAVDVQVFYTELTFILLLLLKPTMLWGFKTFQITTDR